MNTVGMDSVKELFDMIENLRAQNDALSSRLKALEIRRGLRPGAAPVQAKEEQKPAAVSVEDTNSETRTVNKFNREKIIKPRQVRKKRGPRAKKGPVTLLDLLEKDRHALATAEITDRVSGFFLDHNHAAVEDLSELTGGVRSVALHYIKVFKKHGLIQRDGGEQQGDYALTEKGRNVLSSGIFQEQPTQAA